MARGQIAADVLFIGEAPGISEDTIGIPFCGPAGKLLDHIIDESIAGRLRYALTNIVCCIPLDDDGVKTAEPIREDIKKCQPRLVELVRIVKPRLIVCVGTLAKKYVSGQSPFAPVDWLPTGQEAIEFEDIVHPAFILRSNIAQQGIAIQRCIARIATRVDNLLGD